MGGVSNPALALAAAVLAGLPAWSLGHSPAAWDEGGPALVSPETSAGDVEAVRWVPSGSLAVVRLSEPDQRASSLRAFLEQSGFFETPAYELITTNPGLMQARIGLLGLAASVGMDGWTAVGHLLGKEAVAAMYPPRQSGGQPGLLIVALGRDTVSRGKFIDAAATAAGLVKGGRPDPATSTTVDGRTVFTAGELRYCVDGEALLISGDADLVRSALGARWGSIPSMAVSGDLDAAEAAAPPDAFIVGALDARAMVRLAASEGNPEFWRFENPLGGFMFGGWADSLRQASAAMAWITERADGLAMTLRIDRDRDAPAGRTGFGLPALAGSIDLSSLRLPRQVASLSMGRDWASLFSDREEILTVAGASQVAAFAATMTTLMGNFDFTEDFLPRVNGPIRVLLERQDFSEAAYAPSPRLPAFAMVAPLKGASEEMLRQRLMSGSQMALSFINYDAAQKQQPGFLMGLGEHRGVTILKGTYPPPGAGAGLSMMAPGGSGGSSSPDADRRPDEDDADPRGAGEPVNIRYNFEPVVSVVRDHYVLATSMATMRAVIDAVLDARVVERGSDQPLPDQLTITGEEAARILVENREDLVVQRMLEQDEDREQAERVIAALLSAVGMVDSIHASARPTPGGLEATLTWSIRSAGTRDLGQ